MSNYSVYGSEQYKPISAWGYVGYSILFSIPLIGLVFLIIFAFSDKNINRRSYARSYFCWLLILIVITALVSIGTFTGLMNGSLKNSLARFQGAVHSITRRETKAASQPIIEESEQSNVPSLIEYMERQDSNLANADSGSTVPAAAEPAIQESTHDNSPRTSEEMVTVQVGGKTLEIRRSFKDAIDSYESFFDEYIKAIESQDIIRMSSMLAKYAQTLEAFENMDEGEMTDAELAYYTAVSAQIMGKLATAGM